MVLVRSVHTFNSIRIEGSVANTDVARPRVSVLATPHAFDGPLLYNSSSHTVGNPAQKSSRNSLDLLARDGPNDPAMAVCIVWTIVYVHEVDEEPHGGSARKPRIRSHRTAPWAYCFLLGRGLK